jgi:hypothetical protein
VNDFILELQGIKDWKELNVCLHYMSHPAYVEFILIPFHIPVLVVRKRQVKKDSGLIFVSELVNGKA